MKEIGLTIYDKEKGFITTVQAPSMKENLTITNCTVMDFTPDSKGYRIRACMSKANVKDKVLLPSLMALDTMGNGRRIRNMEEGCTSTERVIGRMTLTMVNGLKIAAMVREHTFSQKVDKNIKVFGHKEIVQGVVPYF
jgi:hypothetical protein